MKYSDDRFSAASTTRFVSFAIPPPHRMCCFRGSTTEAVHGKFPRVGAYQRRGCRQNYVVIPVRYRSIAKLGEFWRKLLFFPPKAKVRGSNPLGRASKSNA